MEECKNTSRISLEEYQQRPRYLRIQETRHQQTLRKRDTSSKLYREAPYMYWEICWKAKEELVAAGSTR